MKNGTQKEKQKQKKANVKLEDFTASTIELLIIVSPQCHADTWFDLFDVLLEFIGDMLNQPEIDKRRVYLCGVSIGFRGLLLQGNLLWCKLF